MIRISVLIDSSVLIAYYNEDDENHEPALKIMNEAISGKYGNPIISDYIFSETVTVCLNKTKSIEKTKKFGEHILMSQISVVKIDEAIFNEAWKIFCKSSKLSFTDAASISMLKNLGISYIATFDKDLAKLSGSNVVDN